MLIDFNRPQADALKTISGRDAPSWAIPVFDFIKAWMDESIQNFGIRTSGSTGAPKEIFHSREAMTVSAVRTCNFLDLKAGDSALLALPATHIGGRMMIVRGMVRKLKLICTEPKSDPLASLEYNGVIDFASFTPMQISMILDSPASSARLDHIEKIILGGGEVSHTLKEKLQHIHSPVYETYGMTETISHIALKKLNGSDNSDHFTVLDGVSITVDERSCLVIHAPHLSGETIITNDIVNIINNKQFIWIGRYDNMINTGGIKIAAENIERKLHPYIDRNFFIAGMADDVWGQQVVMIIESPPINEAEQAAYADLFARHLGKYEKPKQVLALGQFSYTETGKVNKNETLQRVKGATL
jgi:O-succinylbenzoic acid--CoA ligase